MCLLAMITGDPGIRAGALEFNRILVGRYRG